jgi:hypothetical protein
MPQKGFDNKTDRLTDCQSLCVFDFDFAAVQFRVESGVSEYWKLGEESVSERV